MKSLSLKEAAVRFRLNDFPTIFRQPIIAIWGAHLTERILRPNETFSHTVRIEVYNSVANFCQLFQRPLEVQKRFLHCVRSGNGKRSAVTHDVWVRVKQDRTEDSFQGCKVRTPLLYNSHTSPKFAVQLQGPEGQQAASERQLRSTPGSIHWGLAPKVLELAVLAGYRCTGSGQPNRFHGSVEVELDGRDCAVAEVGSIEEPIQLVEVNEALWSRKTWIVNNNIDLETYYYVY